ncbi:MAG TPA: ABC transporter ATP-binding protein [Candidatus Corynebacterium gallistercoris]|uniref:ABC transporter ATP-binding protein n=1 Tax=Candidatus Corynebacterium gallistercoris TaxID=2838530 RepID=A0A9D1RXT4_9CORY|nr:ABC transporter ATP-binding protein [Candidatus Corynebacterium gallistercoris]
MADMDVAVRAEGISLTGDEGKVFGPLDFTIPNQGLTSLLGSGGSGRTALALVLSGRMKITDGELEVLGMTKHSKIQKRVAIAGVDQIDFLDRSVKVKDVLTENKAWQKLWIQPVKKATEEDLENFCGYVYGDRSLPPLDAYISQLTNLDKLLIRISLALQPAHGTPAEMLVMDDLEQVREQGDRQVLLHILERISRDIPVVVNSVNPIDTITPVETIELDTNLGHAIPEVTGDEDGYGMKQSTEGDQE